MRPISLALLLGALCAVATQSIAAPERPSDASRAGQAVERLAAARGGESAAVAALLDSVDRELAAERPQQALALLERALRIEPVNPALWHYLGLANLALGNHAQAEAMAAKSHSLAGGSRTLTARNAELTATALRAQGKPVSPASREWPSVASRTAAGTQLEPAVAYVDARDRYARQSLTAQRAPRSIERTPRPAVRTPSAARPARGDYGTERVRRQRAAPRAECWIAVPNRPARRQTPTQGCDALSGQPPRADSSRPITRPPESRVERRSQRRYRSRGYQL